MHPIDLDLLLAPISEENPCGEPLSPYEGELMDVKDAWDAARTLINEQKEKIAAGGYDALGQPWRSIPDPEWQPVIDAGLRALETKTKDFRIAGWITEALARTHGFAGLRAGLELCMELCKRYWDNVFPRPTESEGHLETMIGFRGLCSETGSQAVLDATLVKGRAEGSRGEKSYSVLDYLRAKELDKVGEEERQHRIEEGQPEVSEVQEIASLTDDELHRDNLAAVDECLALLKELDEFFRENCEPDEDEDETYPSVETLRETLQTARRAVSEFTSETEPEPPADPNGDDPSGVVSATPAKGAMTREKAFSEIEKIARFFEKTEPHSPVSFALRQAVRWGKAPLPELLQELIDDSSVMDNLQRLIGLPNLPDADD